MLPRLMDVIRRPANFYPMLDCTVVRTEGDGPLMWSVDYPSDAVRVWYQPIEDEL